MQLNTLMAAAVAAAFALPAYAAGDKASSGAGATKPDGGAEAMFKSLDKNNDGSLTKAEVKGTPHEKDFDKLDKNHDGKLTRAEHAAAPEHQKAASGASSSRDTAQSKTQNKTQKY